MTDVHLPVKVGQLVAGKYLVERVLGVGGMGVVLAAKHVGLGQRVAIKFLLPEARAVGGVTERFANEARASACLKSDHVTRILDVDVLPDGTPYMVMEFLEGRDLSAILAERVRIPVEEACDYVLQACEALAEAHANGIVHRDLKPGNLFVARTPDGGETIKLLDFGISKNVGPGGDFSLTKTSAVLGSPLYMPPEQMSSARTVDARADIWALGIVLYEAVTGMMPFDGTTLTGIVATIIQEPPKPMSVSGVGLPDGFEEVVLRCLEKSPAHRFASIGELAQKLARFAPRTSATSVDRISRLEARLSPAGPMASKAVVSPSEPPMQLVRIRRIEPKTVPALGRPAGAAGAVTHTAQVVDARRARRARDAVDRSEGSSWSWRPFVVVPLLVGVVAFTVHFAQTGRVGRAATAPAPPPEPAVPAVQPRPSEPPPAEPPSPDTAAPAPPATFTAETPLEPSPSARPARPPLPPKGAPSTVTPAAAAQPPVTAPRPKHPAAPSPSSPSLPSIDMEPK